jgi:hypothetical protein
VKRFLVLLVVVAGGLAVASFTVPTNAAVVDGQAITQNQLNADVTAIANSADYTCYLNAQQAVESSGQAAPLPAVDGVEQPGHLATSSTAFVANYLETAIGHQLVLKLAAEHHVRVTSQEVKDAHTGFANEISSILSDYSQAGEHCWEGAQPPTGADVLATMPAAFVQENAQFDASVAALEESLVGGPRAYYDSHRSLFETACFTIAPYSTVSAAESARGLVYEGASFASLASQVAGGGPQACEDLFGVVSALPSTADLTKLALNTVSAPISYGGQYLLVEITKRTPLSYSAAQADIEAAAQSAGATKTEKKLDTLELHATVVLDPRYGVWKPEHAEVLPPAQPPASDVLRAAVNSPITTTPTTTPTTPATGSSPSGQSG